MTIYNFTQWVFEPREDGNRCGQTTAQLYQVYAVAFDSGGQSARSQTVSFSLGADEVAPVVNIAAPVVSGTDNGVDIAEVTEDSSVVFKVTGYDNVGIGELTVSGIRQQGNEFLLTGDPADRLSGEQFSPQLIPDTINAYSALKLVKVPPFSGLNVDFDRYPVEVQARDRSGNTSTASLAIAVVADAPPVVVEALASRQSYLPQGTVEINVQARDDRSVVELSAEYFLDGAPTPFATQVVNAAGDLIPGENVQTPFQLDLAGVALSNQEHSIRVSIDAANDRTGYRHRPGPAAAGSRHPGADPGLAAVPRRNGYFQLAQPGRIDPVEHPLRGRRRSHRQFRSGRRRRERRFSVRHSRKWRYPEHRGHRHGFPRQ